MIMIRLSHALDSSTVFPDLEKFIKSKATDAVTIAAMVEVIPAAIADVIVEMQVVKLQNIALIITKMQAQQEENHQ